jgi:hypothetical protein
MRTHGHHIATLMAAAFSLSPMPELILPKLSFGDGGIGSRHNKNWPGGNDFPHSSKRQRDRYARQIAAGQLRMDGIPA